MQLTYFTDYSLRALIYLAVHPKQLCTVKEIAEAFNISYHHMVKVIYMLGKHRYIRTRKGKNGGISLSKPPRELNIGKVIRHIEPHFNVVECFNEENNKCHITHICKLKHAFYNAHNAFMQELEKYTLADLIINKKHILKNLNK